MKSSDLLIDTHALLWYDSQPHKLPARVRAALTNTNKDVYCSAISLYEIWQKATRGSAEITIPRVQSLTDNLPSYGFKVLPIHAHHSRLAASLAWDNRDPFDRIIAAQAIVDGMHIVTADKSFSALHQIEVVWE